MKILFTTLLSSALLILTACSTVRTVRPHELVAGSWEALDYVPTKAKFKPGQKYFKGELYLKKLVINKDGSTNFPAIKWEKSTLINIVDKTKMNFEVRTLNGTEYLFLEWINGDVTRRGAKPQLYVLKRAGSEN